MNTQYCHLIVILSGLFVKIWRFSDKPVTPVLMDKFGDSMFALFIFCAFWGLTVCGLLMRCLFAAHYHAVFSALSLPDSLHALFWGWSFDAAVAGVLLLPSVLFIYLRLRLFPRSHSILLIWVLLPVLVLLTAQVGDLMYFDSSGRHVSYEIRELLPQFPALFMTAWHDYREYLLGVVGFSALLIGLGCRLRLSMPAKRWTSLELPLLIWLLMGVLAFRGSLTDTPMSPDKAYALGNELQANLALNGAYSGLFGILRADHIKPYYRAVPALEPAALQDAVIPLLNRSAVLKRPTRKMNVVLMLLESWPAVQMHSFNPEAPLSTPEFDRLRLRGLTTDGLVAGGLRTHEGLYTAVCSAQNPLGGGVPKTELENYTYHCLPKILKENGWSVAMFQGSHTDPVGPFAQRLGAQYSYGKLDMPKGQLPQNGWGYQDPDLYEFVLSKAEQEQKPFFYMINTTTTHDMVLPPGTPWTLGSDTADKQRLSLLHYADQALGDFIRKWETSAIGPTLFVLMADHTRAIQLPGLPKYLIPFGMFATDGSVSARHLAGIGSQRDIAPTILHELGGEAPWFSGQALQQAAHLEGDYFFSGHLGWTRDERLVEVDMTNPEQMRCFNWRNNVELKVSRPCDKEDEGLRQRVRGFTEYSQQLLFAGKTGEFGHSHP